MSEPFISPTYHDFIPNSYSGSFSSSTYLCNRKDKKAGLDSRVGPGVKPKTFHTIDQCSANLATKTATFHRLFLSFSRYHVGNLTHVPTNRINMAHNCESTTFSGQCYIAHNCQFTTFQGPHWPPNCYRKEKKRRTG